MMRQTFLNRTKFLKSILSTLLLFLFFGSSAFATACDKLAITNTNTTIQVNNITAPKAIIKIFDANWERLFECNDNCGSEVEINNLNAGEYHVQAQLFDADWNGLCDTIIDVSLSGCFCPAVFIPVCGVDGKTYGNECEAACAGVAVMTEGECTPPITTCDLLSRITFNPDLCSQCLSEIAIYTFKEQNYLVYLGDNIICSDALTTVVDCDTGEEFCLIGGFAGFTCGDFEEEAVKIETVIKKDCTPCTCPEIYAPVCGVDGKTYGNECEAACAGVEVAAEGECESCICTTEYAPVCGADGKTYSNRCGAACAGVDIISEGECARVTTCDLLARITLPTNLCEQGLTEIAVYELNGQSYLVYIADNVLLADGQTTVVDCNTGEEFCVIGGIAGFTCDGFLDKAEKLETIVQQDCENCICPEIYAPVCGVDGKTYSNECEATCAGVEIAAEGECQPCVCDTEYAPVCGVDGKMYSNRCMADCAGVDIISEGECAPVTTCDLLARITFSTDLCSQCLSEIAIYTLDGKNYLVYIGDHIICADVPNLVVDCDTGEEFCNDGGGELPSTCGNFFGKAEKIATILEDDCTPCICTLEYAPVCGADGKTYGNRCEADCAGVDILEEGECPCICPTVALPVCGVDGKTYGNACQAACAGVEVAFDGSCEECLSEPLSDVACPQVYDPVCGCNGITYGNACEAEVAGVKSWTEGTCPDPDDCFGPPIPEIRCDGTLAPVCGCDGKTYQNECTATQNGILSFTEGACVIDCCEDECRGLPTPGAPCDDIYEPVCACDERTYDNECIAQSLGLKSWTEGECQLTTIECGEITISYDQEKIVMKGNPEANYFFKVHDVNNGYHEIFDCSESCGSQQTANLPTGEYLVKIYDADWNRICEQSITLGDSTESEIESEDGLLNCGDAMITYKDGTVKLVGDVTKSYHMKILDTRYKAVFACTWECGSTITANNIPTGFYTIQVLDGDYKVLCEESISITNTATIRETTPLQVAAYPNPAQTEFFIKIKNEEKEIGSLQVVNTFGQIIHTQVIERQSKETVRLDLKDYQNGLYYYQLKLPKRPVTNGKFLVSRLY